MLGKTGTARARRLSAAEAAASEGKFDRVGRYSARMANRLDCLAPAALQFTGAGLEHIGLGERRTRC
jgi:hypothetical protein